MLDKNHIYTQKIWSFLEKIVIEKKTRQIGVRLFWRLKYTLCCCIFYTVQKSILLGQTHLFSPLKPQQNPPSSKNIQSISYAFLHIFEVLICLRCSSLKVIFKQCTKTHTNTDRLMSSEGICIYIYMYVRVK